MPSVLPRIRHHPVIVEKMTVQRTLRSNTTLKPSEVAISRSQYGDHSLERKNLAEGPTSLTATMKLAKKRQRSRKSEEDPTPPLAKRARIQTPEPQQKVLSKHSQEISDEHSSPPNQMAKVSFDRPAEPHTTNAPLVTPRSSWLATYHKETVDASQTKSGVPRPTTTTSGILDEACAHLVRMEPMLQPLVEKHYCRVFCPEGLAEGCDPFRSLCNSIMAQQVSGAAASSIRKKFVELFDEPLEGEKVEEAKAFPAPAQVAACT